LDSRGLTKEADIVDNIAKKYREGGKELSDNIKNVVDNAKRDDFDKAVDYSNKNIQKAAAEKELGKTAEWFKKTVIPSIRENRGPIVADQDYHTNYFLNKFNIIRKGSSFSDIESRSSDGGLGLKSCYENLKFAIDEYDLRIRLDENLFEKIYRKVTDVKTNFKRNIK